MLERALEWWVTRKLGKIDPRHVPSDAELSSLEDAKNGVISLSVTTFTVQAPKFTASVDWEKLTSIFAYRRDLHTTDLICMGFACAANDPVIEVHTEMAGFLRLRREAERRCPGLSDGFSRWLLNSRAFDTTARCVWEKPKA